LSLYQFKNHSEFQIDFEEDITCIIGNNGKGKTNILDAIYLLSTCKSYFNPIDYQLISHGQNIASINASFSNSQQYDLKMTLESGKKKKLKKNDKLYDKLIDHIGLINAVMITPDDVELVYGHSDVRRRFIDICISQTDRVYLNNLNEYNKVLEQRNSQLKIFARHKHFDEIIIESFDTKLIQTGTYIYGKRAEVLGILNQAFNELYPAFSSGMEKVQFKYKSDLNESHFKDLLKNNLDKDLQLERTSGGVHRDDIEFEIEGFPLKRFGSQGQSKSFIFAFKLAQYQYLYNTLKTKPILLLDDMFEKIDEERAQKLINLLCSHEFGQIVLTDTHSDRVRNHFENVNKSIKFVNL
jgi:DNA replication and repair protein RecF